MTVMDVIEYKPLHGDLSIETPLSEPFVGTVGPPLELGNLFSLLKSGGLLPDDLTSNEGEEQSRVSFTHLRALLFDALFRKDADQQNGAWDDLFSLVDEGKHSQNGDTWLGLEAFMLRLKRWTVGKDSEDIRLVFNAGEIELANWIDALTAEMEVSGENNSDTVTSISGNTAKTTAGMALLFNPDEMRVVDMLIPDQITKLWTCATTD